MDNRLIYGLGCLVLAYLLGSIPTAVWVGKAFFGLDVREHGSGNAGATNTFRILGKPAGTFVLLTDTAKGFAGTALAWFMLSWGLISIPEVVYWQLGLGLAAVTGHIFPIFAGFKGGKGVATLLGMVLCLHPQAAAGCVLVFLVMFLSMGYVSAGSMAAALAFPIQIILLYQSKPFALVIFGFLISWAVVVTHRKNIKRLMAGTESKVRFWGK